SSAKGAESTRSPRSCRVDAEPPSGPDPAETALARLRATLGVATLVMLGLSWPLWVQGGTLPRVPFVAGVPAAPLPVAWAAFVIVLAAIAAAAVGIRWRASLAFAVAILAILIVQDQHRFQPWVYQFLMLSVILVSLPPAQALAYSRWWFAALYVHS